MACTCLYYHFDQSGWIARPGIPLGTRAGFASLLVDDEALRMGLLLARNDAPPTLSRSPLNLVVQVYLATYLLFTLIGALCFGIAGAFHRRKEEGAPPPARAWRRS